MDPEKSRQFSTKIGYFAAGLAFAVTMSGCPDGAELENPERFQTVVTGAGAVAGTGAATGGTGGATAGASAGGSAGAAAGSAGSAGQTFSCDVAEALARTNVGSCGISGCHSVAAAWGDVVLVDPAALGPMLVDQPAMFTDIDCAAEGEPYRACTPAEIPATCPTGALLINSQDFEASWIIRKMDPNFPGDCGDKMPIAPGNAPEKWTQERQQCLTDFFRSLIPAQ